MKKYLFAMALFAAAFGLTSCSSDDDSNENVAPQEDTIIGIWFLQGFGSDANFHSLKDEQIRRCSTYFNRAGNTEIQLEYYWVLCRFEYNDQGKLILLDGQVQRYGGWDASSDTAPLEEYLQPNKTLNYEVTESYLKLYYSADEYILFKRGKAKAL